MANRKHPEMRSLLQQTLQDFLKNPEKGALSTDANKYASFQRPIGKRKEEVRAEIEALEAKRAVEIEQHRIAMLEENLKLKAITRAKLEERKQKAAIKAAAAFERFKELKKQEKLKKLSKQELVIQHELRREQQELESATITTNIENA